MISCSPPVAESGLAKATGKSSGKPFGTCAASRASLRQGRGWAGVRLRRHQVLLPGATGAWANAAAEGSASARAAIKPRERTDWLGMLTLQRGQA